MKETTILPADYKIKQEAWPDSPCSSCFGSPCCGHLPLTHLSFRSRTDFLALAMLACFRNIILGQKETGEWTIYYHQNCMFLDTHFFRCTIHGLDTQSVICKSYDAHTCWYRPAFSDTRNRTLILFDLPRLLWLEKHTRFLRDGTVIGQPSRTRMIMAFNAMPLSTETRMAQKVPALRKNLLPFYRHDAQRFLFFPPFEKPTNAVHYELIRFRLGFPGVHLAVADNSWAYLICTQLRRELFQQFTREYFPGLEARHNCFSFSELQKQRLFYSELGNIWVIADLSHLHAIKAYTTFDWAGNIKRLPAAGQILEIIRTLNPRKPDKAA